MTEEPLWSVGGAGGTRAMTQDLEWACRALAHAREALDDCAAELARARVEAEFDPVASAAGWSWWCSSLLVGAGGARDLVEEVVSVKARLTRAVAAYEDAEREARRGIDAFRVVRETLQDGRAVTRWWASALAGLAWWASVPGTAFRLAGADPIGAALSPHSPPPTTSWLTGGSIEGLLSGATGTPERFGDVATVFALAGAGLEALASEPAYGGVVATRECLVRAPPTSLRELMDALGDVERLGDGSVRIESWTDPSGRRRHIVYLPGTQDWGVSSVNPSDAQANLALVAGHSADAVRLVRDAMADARIRPGEPVLVAGHSQGGIVAAAVAASRSLARRFTITHVVTAGSPVGRISIPARVSALHLEGTRDVVPGLDGTPNPDTPTRVTVLHDARRSREQELAGRARDVASAHHLDTYAQTARLVDEGASPSADAWRASAVEFFGPRVSETTRFSPQR